MFPGQDYIIGNVIDPLPNDHYLLYSLPIAHYPLHIPHYPSRRRRGRHKQPIGAQGAQVGGRETGSQGRESIPGVEQGLKGPGAHWTQGPNSSERGGPGTQGEQGLEA